ncbi:peptidoglycan-binding protein LysM [Lactococcus hodotermopsidis]|uniref:Peptidoglycan-binding protein LysM n=1 Tax=Pseudolactococcus hodotermopsidis TaxID=2709157 RepID=A0A6A0BDV7_9LACT|nr:SAG1386/EF1546 family surface-associated protein [Lactococcus hodotermopsidis]GFH42664.1 peptidoglycan-binding protein LysM [Lactococcus hodotermopsidis]
MAKNNEPWNNEIYHAMQESREDGQPKRAVKKSQASTNFLTFLVVLMFMIIGGIVVVIVWNNRFVDNTKISTSFYTSKSTSAEESRSSEEKSETSSVKSSVEKSEKSEEADDPTVPATTIVEDGEGLYTISQRTGVPLEKIAKINGMTVETWYANPGQEIKLK